MDTNSITVKRALGDLYARQREEDLRLLERSLPHLRPARVADLLKLKRWVLDRDGRTLPDDVRRELLVVTGALPKEALPRKRQRR